MKYGKDNHGVQGVITNTLGHLAIDSPSKGKTYQARIRKVTMRKGKVIVEWVIFNGYEKKGAKTP